MRNPARDPFGERRRLPHRCRLRVLGARVAVESNSRRLLALLDHAFAKLPAHRLRGEPPRLRLRLVLGPMRGGPVRRHLPPPLRLRADGDLLIGHFDAENFTVVDVGRRQALICVSHSMLSAPYYLRYELMEFALLTLAPRVQGLVPLHAACVARGGRAVLVCGDSGAGKSTLTVAGLERGLALVAEDGVFADPHSLRTTGCANFLHLGRESLGFVRDARLRARFRASPTIRRRSGARKLELDARAAGLPLARRAPRLAALVLLSRRRARTGTLLRPLSAAEARRALGRLQPYAAGQPDWREFVTRVTRLPAYRLLRGAHPGDGADEVHGLLASP